MPSALKRQVMVSMIQTMTWDLHFILKVKVLMILLNPMLSISGVCTSNHFVSTSHLTLLDIHIEEIIRAWPYFPRFHALYAGRPNVNPIAVTTGIGPTGPQTQWLQRPDDFIDPTLREREVPSTSPATPSAVSPALAATRSFGSEQTNTYEPATPPSSQLPVSNPPSQPPTSSTARPPKPSTASHQAIDKLKATIQVIPKKRSVVEVLMDASKYVPMS
jgi:hypothetical protein